MKFRLFQFCMTLAMLTNWFIRYVNHPHHLHATMLAMSAVVLVVSEISYRVGKKEKQEDSDQASDLT